MIPGEVVSRTNRFTRLYEDHHNAVLAYCLRRTNTHDAHDAASEAFSVAWRRLDDMPAGAKQLPWLYGVARNVLSHQRRSAGRFRRLVGRVGAQPVRHVPDPASEVLRRHEFLAVLDAAATLTMADQEILRLAAWEGLKHADIAEILGISIGAVDQRLHRAKKRLVRAYERGTSGEGTTILEGGVA